MIRKLQRAGFKVDHIIGVHYTMRHPEGGRPFCPITGAGYQTRRQITTLIRRYVAALEARGITVERVILFGSYAAGHAQEWSDIDIAVISPKFYALSLLDRYEQLGLANRELQAPLDVMGFSPSQVAHCDPGSFLAEILRTGVTIPLRQHGPIVSRRKGQDCAR